MHHGLISVTADGEIIITDNLLFRVIRLSGKAANGNSVSCQTPASLGVGIVVVVVVVVLTLAAFYSSIDHVKDSTVLQFTANPPIDRKQV